MADPIKWKTKIILAKVEGTYGTDAEPAAADAMLMTDVELRPMEGQDIARNSERPHLGAQETIPAGLYVTLTGSVELQGSGAAGTAPGWGILMRSCAAAETAVMLRAIRNLLVKHGPDSIVWVHDGLYIRKDTCSTNTCQDY